jgi:hypothetical protein
MKKTLLLISAVLLLGSAAAAESRFFLGAGANYIRPADENYRAVYGNQAIYPEYSVAVRLVAGLCLTGSMGRIAKNGTTPDLGLETRAVQSYFTAGLGYLQRISRLLCFQAGAGVAALSFREDALGAFIEGHKTGLAAEGGLLIVPEDERVYMGIKVGYLAATVEDLDPVLSGRQSVRLGGLKIAVSVGIQLFGSD